MICKMQRIISTRLYITINKYNICETQVVKHNILKKHGGRELQMTRIAHGWSYQSLLALLKAITSIVDQIPKQNWPQHQPLKLLIYMKMSSLLVRFCFGLKICWSLKSSFFSLPSIKFFPCRQPHEQNKTDFVSFQRNIKIKMKVEKSVENEENNALYIAIKIELNTCVAISPPFGVYKLQTTFAQFLPF